MRLLTSAMVLMMSAGGALAQDSCAAGKTLEDGVLTIATGNPAYYPWVMNDDPESKEGFEAAVAYAVAGEMGFSDDQVTWVRSSFDEAIQPGVKNFDFNLQQYSITPERDEIVDFSAPYYSAAMAVLTTEPVAAGGATPDLDSLAGLKWGGVASHTSYGMITGVIQPDSDPLLYGDNADVTEAMKARQIDAALFDLPTALFLAAVMLDDGVVLGQFPADRSENPDQFGMLFEEGNPLKDCVDAALESLKASGRLAEIEAQWLAEATGVPVIE
ncbi:transporter substrate-binding domain-containing protein [Alphaproteobacteria bacterium GH1-50]|uniref:Transporter substrate-binding domain-containing protein n=1 Tax=Kangsaoukella pontilimi TaxID=2691042 RepID=A0A7C9MFW9_9RHOB|nr:ABC transporter substrate-binding protein [Kangsaoukella pontilimi]MXQ07956.1 transporter substrate-binding domain-containing protein [Kangsaoukella pontilimi]